MHDDNLSAPLQLLEAALSAPESSQARKDLVSKALGDTGLYGRLLDESLNHRDRAQQLKAKNWLLWLEQESNR